LKLCSKEEKRENVNPKKRKRNNISGIMPRKPIPPKKTTRMRNTPRTRSMALRQNEAFRLKTQLGLNNSLIAKKMGLSVRTINGYFRNLNTNLQSVKTRKALTRKGGYWPPAPEGVYLTPKQRIRGARIRKAAKLITERPDIAAQRYARRRDVSFVRAKQRVRDATDAYPVRALSAGRPFLSALEKIEGVKEPKLPTRQVYSEQRRGKTGMQFVDKGFREKGIERAQDIRFLHSEIRRLKGNLNLLNQIERTPARRELSGKLLADIKERGLSGKRNELSIPAERTLINQQIEALRDQIGVLRPEWNARAARREKRFARGKKP